MILKPVAKNDVFGGPEYVRYNKSIYGRILRDDGMFAPISALQRMTVAQRVFDPVELL